MRRTIFEPDQDDFRDWSGCRRSVSAPRSPTSRTRRRSSTRPSRTPRSARRSASRSAPFQHNKFLIADLRDARVTKIWAGSNEIMKELIGRDLGL